MGDEVPAAGVPGAAARRGASAIRAVARIGATGAGCTPPGRPSVLTAGGEPGVAKHPYGRIVGNQRTSAWVPARRLCQLTNQELGRTS